jgi:hydrogenase expression/formation protein HypE
MGKLPNKDLKQMLGCIRNDKRVVVPPQLGFDAGVHLLDNGKCLVVATDPCLGVPEEWFGWLMINYVASDIALFGAKTEFCTINLLGAPSTEPATFHMAMRQACDAANELGTAVVTGHTGTYEGLSTLVGVCTGYGYINRNRLLTPGNAKPDDHILCIKPVGLETVVNFALTHGALAEKLFGTKRTKELAKLVTMQSCVKEALMLAEVKGVHAMHDATEGGLTAALNEMAEASGVGFNIEWEQFLVPEEVHVLREFYGLSDTELLAMSSTGTVLAAVSPEAREEVEDVLHQNGVEAKFLGSFTKDARRVLVKNGKETGFPRVASDPYARIFQKNSGI